MSRYIERENVQIKESGCNEIKIGDQHGKEEHYPVNPRGASHFYESAKTKVASCYEYCWSADDSKGGLFLLAFSKAAASFGIWYFLMYFCLGAANIAESALLNRKIPGQHRAGMLSFFSLVTQFGAFLAAGIAGAAVAFRSVGTLWAWEGFTLVAISAGIGVVLKKVVGVSQAE